jgi:hypothetical protein
MDCTARRPSVYQESAVSSDSGVVHPGPGRSPQDTAVFSQGCEDALQYLGNRDGRRFANRWEFGCFAQEHRLDLDFTTPPKRPARP